MDNGGLTWRIQMQMVQWAAVVLLGFFSPIRSAGILEISQEILTKILIIEQILWGFANFGQNIHQKRFRLNIEQAGAELCPAQGKAKLFLHWLNPFDFVWLTWNLKEIESKVFCLERLYPSFLVQVSKSQKNWLRNILGLKKIFGQKEIQDQKNVGSKKNCGSLLRFWIKTKL